VKNFYSDVELMMQNKYKEDNRDYLKLLQAGNTAQIEKLRENEHKPGFDNIDINWAFKRLHDEFRELFSELSEDNKDYSLIRKEAADVANFAHMIILAADQEMNK
jgi:hypothetical protein